MDAPLPVAEALARILARCRRLPAEALPLDDAAGRVLAADAHADLDLPPFDNSAMDGYAVRLADVAVASEPRPVILDVHDVIMAAPGQPEPLRQGFAAKIMTGAPVPDGAEAVIPVELAATPADGQVSFTAVPKSGANVRPRGSDLRQGEVVVPAGTTLRHAELALMAAVGLAEVDVVRQPRVVFVSTGDELVPCRETPGPGQIRDSSVHALPAQLRAAGCDVVQVAHAVDTESALVSLFNGLPAVDLVVCCGGVSMGDKDFVRPVFERLGERDFWRVAVKPGKPLLFGQLGPALFFGLPGNPVSSMVACDVFVTPAIDALLGRVDGGRLTVAATMAHALRSDPARQEYVRVKLRTVAGELVAEATGNQSSGRMTSMLGADGYAVIPDGVGQVAASGAVTVELFRR